MNITERFERNEQNIRHLQYFQNTVLPELLRHGVQPAAAKVANVDKHGFLRLSKAARWAVRRVKKARREGGVSDAIAAEVSERLSPGLWG
jgi:hypothetical protein